MSPWSPRFFNTAGPCRPADHYMLPPARRLPELRRLVEERQLFALHAARQTGKTTTIRALAAELRAEGVVALHVSLEASRQIASPAAAEPIWLSDIAMSAEFDLLEADRPPAPETLGTIVGTRLRTMLARWAAAVQPRPLVLFLDEVDTIEGEAMVTFLAQLRAGFNQRPHGFPSSIALVGLRDLKDYLIAAKGGLPPNPGSPFNIKARSLTLRNFTLAEVTELYAQHTTDTGQPFTEAAIERVFYWSQGQPFLVNALGYRVTREEPVPIPEPILAEHIDAAKEALIQSRTTHLDNLAHRLYEPRVARIVRPVLMGESPPRELTDDLDYVRDLGLLTGDTDGLAPANPLYREVLARALSAPLQISLPLPRWPWRRADGGLDFPELVDRFLAWWREQGDILIDDEGATWREAAAHLAFMAFLQRVVNGGGEVRREYASGRGRLDLLVRYGDERFVAELKRVPPAHLSLETVRARGIEQLAGYLDQLGLDEGWLVIFDQRVGRTWEERMWREEVEVAGKRLHLRGA